MLEKQPRWGSVGRLIILGPMLWTFCAQFFIVEQIALHAWRFPYSMRNNYISDLGAVICSRANEAVVSNNAPICSPLHSVMNTSFLLQGCLILFGTLLTARILPRSTLVKIAIACLCVAGLGVALLGLAPEDTHHQLHIAGAACHLTFGNVGIVLIGFGLLRTGRCALRAWAIVSAVLGCFGLIALLFLGTHQFLGLGPGEMERTAAYPIPTWFVISGLLMVRSVHRTRVEARLM